MRLTLGDKEEYITIRMQEEENDNLIYGIHPVKEAILTGKVIDKLLVQTGLKGENATELKRMARKA